MLLRGLLQPLTERRMLADSERLSEAMRIAEASAEGAGEDPVLGVAARAL
jgi:hypothetical protein